MLFGAQEWFSEHGKHRNLAKVFTLRFFFHPDYTVGPGVSPDRGRKVQWLAFSGQ
jgi:hypothetical protein